MRILQLIDTLNVGGAERVALNYANSLIDYEVDSHICVTRERGNLEEEINDEVQVHYLNKQSTLDFKSLYKLIKIIQDYKINVVHAHGTSWFFAALCKIYGLNFKLIWHDHYGKSDFLQNRKVLILKLFSSYFDGIIAVNEKLLVWSRKNLNCKNVKFLKNFVILKKDNFEEPERLQGGASFNIICVANLRAQKDHGTLLRAFNYLKKNRSDVALHIIGKNFKDEYSLKLIERFNSTSSVFWYGEKTNIDYYLKQMDIGVLSSISEGLPLALLEYGQAGIGVIVTDVGECKKVVGKYGIIVPSSNAIKLAEAMTIYFDDQKRLVEDSNCLKSKISKIYSVDVVMKEYIVFCNNI